MRSTSWFIGGLLATAAFMIVTPTADAAIVSTEKCVSVYGHDIYNDRVQHCRGGVCVGYEANRWTTCSPHVPCDPTYCDIYVAQPILDLLEALQP